jgi:hypothetical protein
MDGAPGTSNDEMRGSFTSFRMTTRDMVQDDDWDMVQVEDVSVQHDDMQRQRQRQRLAGLGYAFPPIAKSAMDGAPVRCGLVEEDRRFGVGLLRKTGDDL